MLSVVYTSVATGTFDDADLATLLMNSRSTNRRLGITGLLLHRDGRFLQILEGPDEVVRERLRLIEADPRHHDVAVLVEDEVDELRFPTWSMGYEAVTDELADQIPGYRSTFDDLDPVVPAGSEQPAVRQLVQWFQKRVPEAA